MSRRVAILSPSYDGKTVCDFTVCMAVIFQRAAKERPDLELNLNFWMNEAIIQKARNNLFSDAYLGGFDDIVFIDVDQGFDAQAFFDILDHPVDAVGIPVPMKVDEERYNIRPEDTSSHKLNASLGLLEVACIGTGFLRLSRKAMGILWDTAKPYFDGKERRMICNVEIDNGGLISEDVQICKKLTDAGLKIYADINHTCTHFGVKKYSGNYHEFYATNIIEKILKIKTK
jgi:hypothetical protein